MSPVLDLRKRSPLEQGRARGEQFRGAIERSVGIRSQRVDRQQRTDAWAALQPRLEPQLEAELLGLAQGAALEASDLMLCFDEDCGLTPPERGDPGTLALYVVAKDGGVLGQTLDVDEGDAHPVAAWSFGNPGAERLAVGHPGGLGHCGFRRGLAVTCNPLVGARPPGAPEQEPWSAVFRSLVGASSLGQARAILDRLGPRSGHWHVMLAAVGHDRSPDFSGMECSDARVIRTQSGPQTGHVHASHYFDPVQRKQEALESNASWNRLERATTAYAQHRPASLEALRTFLADFVWESGPRKTSAVAAFEVSTGRAELCFTPGSEAHQLTLD